MKAKKWLNGIFAIQDSVKVYSKGSQHLENRLAAVE